jgi:alkylation response protein AidB-like acyl-CoA dehydrogenase
MAKYRADLKDLYFNLFDLFKVQESGGLGEQDIREIVESFNKFVEMEIYPSRQTADHEGLRFEANQVYTPKDFKRAQEQFYSNGWYGLCLPEEIGGMPMPHPVYIGCTSLIVGANCSFSMYYGLTRGAMNVIMTVGSDEQKNQFIPPMMEGRWGGTMCLTEANAGSDVGAAKTTATPNGDGSYSIKGTKIFISSGENDLYENIIHLVLARTPGAPEGTKGLSLFIVPKFKIKDDGSNGEANDVVCTNIEEKMGLHASATCVLNFGDKGACQGYLIGNEFDGMTNMFIMMNEARLLCGLQGESQANLAYELTDQYVRERGQFGREIIHHPDVKRTLLRMRAMGRGMRMLNLYTGALFDQLEGGDRDVESLIALLTPICKSYCSDEGFNVAVDAIQLHGGYGYCSEYGVEQFARDIKIATIYEGTNGIQAIDFVMRKILKDGAQTFMKLGAEIQGTLKSPDVKDFAKEAQLMGLCLKKAQEIVETYGGYAKAQNIDAILSSATDFQTFAGHLIVGWLHLKSALVAQEKLKSSTEAQEQQFLRSKIVDFQVFAQCFMTRNLALAESILGFDRAVSSLEV